MEPTTIVLMEKNLITGYLQKEVGSYTVEENGELISNIFLIEEDNKKVVHLKITTEKDIKDEDYDKVYDNYDMDSFLNSVLSIKEVEEEYNPTWEITFEFSENIDVFQNKLQDVVNIHKDTLEKAYNNIM